jgi:hypothetical protein
LAAIQVEEGNACFLSDDGVLFDKDKTTLLCCPGGKTGCYTVPEGTTAIGTGAFYGCSRLTSIIIPESVTSVGGFAFSRCSSLTSIAISQNITRIREGAFSLCPRLVSVAIPGGVTKIEYRAFDDCTALRDVTVFWEAPSEVRLEADIFDGVDTRSVRLHVPPETEAAYRAAAVWKDFETVQGAR